MLETILCHSLGNRVRSVLSKVCPSCLCQTRLFLGQLWNTLPQIISKPLLVDSFERQSRDLRGKLCPPMPVFLGRNFLYFSCFCLCNFPHPTKGSRTGSEDCRVLPSMQLRYITSAEFLSHSHTACDNCQMVSFCCSNQQVLSLKTWRLWISCWFYAWCQIRLDSTFGLKEKKAFLWGKKIFFVQFIS